VCAFGRSRVGRAWVSVAVLVVAAACLAACGSSNNSKGSSSGGGSSSSSGGSGSEIVLSDLQGPAATGDGDFTKGMLIAQNQINAAGGIDGHKVKVAITDFDGTPAGAISAYTAAGGTNALAAFGGATGVLAMESASDRVGLPLAGVPGRIDFVAPPHKWVFSISADAAYPDAAVRWAVDNKHIKTIAILHYTDTDYSNGIVASITQRCTKTTGFGPALGCKVVDVESATSTDTIDQLIPLLTKMKNSGADAYYIETLDPNGPKAARQLGMFNKPVLSEQWLSVPAIATACGAACDGIVFSAQKCVAPNLIQSSDPEKAYCNDYTKLFTQAYPGQPYALFSVYGYDYVKLMANAAGLVAKAGQPITRANLDAELEKLNGQIRTSHGAVVSLPNNHRLTGQFSDAYFLYVIKTVNGKPVYELAPGSSPQGAQP
jgi:branched-chain amino acid transport system substrate-binding protein